MSEPGSLIRALSGRQAARNFHTFVINEIGAGIVAGTYRVDTTLPNDAQMMDRFGVSRTVLREALKTLEAKGLVEARAKVGTRVLPRNRWNLFDRQVLAWTFDAGPEPGFLRALVQVRETLEHQAVALAATARTSDHLRLLRYWQAQRAACAALPEPCALAQFEMHRILCEASGNPLLRAATGLSEFAIAAAFAPRIAAGLTDFAAPAAGDYARLLLAIEAADPDAAATAMTAILTGDRRDAGLAG